VEEGEAAGAVAEVLAAVVEAVLVVAALQADGNFFKMEVH
jgi:hypothetical protein